jgi:hypothetical protein
MPLQLEGEWRSPGMGVVTVIGEDGVQVLVEFVGGPRDGKRSFAVASTDLEGRPIPPARFAAGQLTDAAAEDGAAAGWYLREGITPDGEALTYVWELEGAPRTPASPPDLATQIRREYARRASAGEPGDPPKPRVMPLKSRIDRRGS